MIRMKRMLCASLWSRLFESEEMNPEVKNFEKKKMEKNSFIYLL